MWLHLQVQGIKAEWRGFCDSASTQTHMRFSDSLYLSAGRMYLSHHLNDYNHCGDGNAWISALTWWNLRGPESRHAPLTSGVSAKTESCSEKCFCPNSWNRTEVNQNQQSEVAAACTSSTLADWTRSFRPAADVHAGTSRTFCHIMNLIFLVPAKAPPRGIQKITRVIMLDFSWIHTRLTPPSCL